MFPFANFTPLGRSYLDLSRGLGTTVIAYDDSTWDGKPAKRLELKASYNNSVTRKEETNRFGFHFRPELRWVCGVMEAFDGEKTLMRTTHRYRPPIDGWPVPATYERYSYSHGPSGPGGKLLMRDTSFIKSPVPFPESEFTLSKWIFPEPENVAPASAAPPLPIDDDVPAPSRPTVAVLRPQWHWGLLVVAGLGFAGPIIWLVRRNRK